MFGAKKSFINLNCGTIIPPFRTTKREPIWTKNKFALRLKWSPGKHFVKLSDCVILHFMYLSESCRTAINLEKPCRMLKSLAEICSCMLGNWCVWRQSVGCGEFGLKLVWWKCEWPLVGQLRILGLTAAVIYERPVQKKQLSSYTTGISRSQ